MIDACCICDDLADVEGMVPYMNGLAHPCCVTAEEEYQEYLASKEEG